LVGRRILLIFVRGGVIFNFEKNEASHGGACWLGFD
jgi:hypothetical protein